MTDDGCEGAPSTSTHRAVALQPQGFRLGLAMLLVLVLAACGSGGNAGKKVLVVFAAASLSSTFGDLEAEFEAAHPDVDVTVSFGGSADLATQIRAGAPADVFASADQETMASLGDLVVDPAPFATNTLQIVVPAGNPGGVRSIADLAEADLDVVVCAPEVPCGRATREVAAAAGVELRPDSEEQSVTDVLGKVAAGEADAGLVYVTDVPPASRDAVEVIAVPEAAAVVNTYPIAVVQGSPRADRAREFADLVRGEAGQRVLRDAGFGPP